MAVPDGSCLGYSVPFLPGNTRFSWCFGPTEPAWWHRTPTFKARPGPPSYAIDGAGLVAFLYSQSGDVSKRILEDEMQICKEYTRS